MRPSRTVAVLTPEHVPVRLVPAGLGSRFCALLLDFTIVLFGMAAITPLLLLLPDSVRQGVSITLGFVAFTGYHAVFDLRFEGRSPGKRVLGLRVVDARGLPVTLQQSMIRTVVRALDFLPFGYGLGAVAAFVDPQGRRLGDLAAGTLVVDERGPRLQAAQLPPAQRFNSLRTPRTLRLVKHRLGLEERDFLVTLCQRADRLAPVARVALMEDAARTFRHWLDLEDPELSGEAFVRDLASLATGRT